MTLSQDLKYVKVREAYETFITDCVKVRTGSLIYKAIEVLLQNPTSQTVYVVDENEKLRGMIPLRDLIRVSSARYGVHGRGFSEFLQYLRDVMKDDVDDIMRPPMNVFLEDNLMKAMKIMEYYDLNSLPVIDKDGKLVGELNGTELLMFAIQGVKKGDLRSEELKTERERKKKVKEDHKKARK